MQSETALVRISKIRRLGLHKSLGKLWAFTEAFQQISEKTEMFKLAMNNTWGLFADLHIEET